MTHVNGIHLHRTILQHTVGKTTSGSTYIHAHLTRKFHAEMIHSLLKLQASTAHVFEGVAPDLYLSSLVKCRAGLILFVIVNIHYS